MLKPQAQKSFLRIFENPRQSTLRSPPITPFLLTFTSTHDIFSGEEIRVAAKITIHSIKNQNKSSMNKNTNHTSQINLSTGHPRIYKPSEAIWYRDFRKQTFPIILIKNNQIFKDTILNQGSKELYKLLKNSCKIESLSAKEKKWAIQRIEKYLGLAPMRFG